MTGFWKFELVYVGVSEPPKLWRMCQCIVLWNRTDVAPGDASDVPIQFPTACVCTFMTQFSDVNLPGACGSYYPSVYIVANHYILVLITMLPEQTSILIVGAGPTGLSAAISLFNQGCKDIIIVDAAERSPDTSRAMAIHAATLEVGLSSYGGFRSHYYDRHSKQSVAQINSLN